jgi:hypothetical protein
MPHRDTMHVANVHFKMFLKCDRYVASIVFDVAKGDRDVAHVVMAIHVCFKCISQMFHLFHMNVAIGLSECCKSGSGCCIYMHVASICFNCFHVFHTYVCKYSVFCLDVAYVCNGFQIFF